MIQPPAEAFRTVMSRFATGVTVMTTRVDDEPHGMTASAVASVSLDPLLVLVCIERDAAMARLVVDAGAFGLSILSVEQSAVSDRFADPDRPPGGAQFDGIGTDEATTGAPILAGALGWVDCRVWATYDGGDHVIVVGEVVDMGLGGPEEALVYFRSGYTATDASRGAR